ncbi:MAG: NAD-dependent epimerase/dehydratase family protein [Dehalococcoidia bacterium]
MDIVVAGGTGVLGRPAIRRLVADGHRVRGLVRSAESGKRVRQLGAEPVQVSLFDAGAVRGALDGAEAVLHLATRIPAAMAARKRDAWGENDRIRQEGTRNLVDAALAAGAGTFIYPSVVLVYPSSGDRWIDAETTAPKPAADLLRSTLDAEAEVARFSARGGRGIVVRMGSFYGYGDDAFSRVMLKAARWGLALMLGPGDAYLSSIWIDDAAGAVVAGLDARVPAGTYDVVDDEPLPRRELNAAIARAVGRRRLWSVPRFLQRPMAGAVAGPLMASLRVSNRRFREASGWAPSVPSARDGWPRLASEIAGNRVESSIAAPIAR